MSNLQSLITALKRKRPDMSVKLARGKTAKDVGELIADSWFGYGLEAQEDLGDDTYKVVVKAEEGKVDEAFKYLWLKPKGKEGGSTIYRMSGMPYEAVMSIDGEEHTIIVRKKTS